MKHDILRFLRSSSCLQKLFIQDFIILGCDVILGIVNSWCIFTKPLNSSLLQIEPQFIRCDALESCSSINCIVLLGIILTNWITNCLHFFQRLCWVCFEAVFQSNYFSWCPVYIIANCVGSMLFEKGFGCIHKWLCMSFHSCFCFSSFIFLNFAVVVINGKHEIILPGIHLYRENSSLVWQSWVSCFIDPICEIEALNGRDGVLLFIFLEDVFVLTWWKKANHCRLRAQNGCIVPWCLNKGLCYIVLCL